MPNLKFPNLSIIKLKFLKFLAILFTHERCFNLKLFYFQYSDLEFIQLSKRLLFFNFKLLKFKPSYFEFLI